MFRKVNKKPKLGNQSRIRRIEEESKDDDHDDNKDDDDEDDIQQRIKQTQRKHKILDALPVASGEGQPTTNKRRFLSSSSSSSHRTSDEELQNLTVLAQKHHRAMEEYIQGNMLLESGDQTQTMKATTTNDGNNGRDDNDVDAEKNLYQELAAATVPSQVLGAKTEEDRGAMLVGGTGLAEVILPKDKKFHNPKQQGKVGVRYSRNPNLSSAVAAGSNSSSMGGLSKTILPTAGFRSMVSTGPHATASTTETPSSSHDHPTQFHSPSEVLPLLDGTTISKVTPSVDVILEDETTLTTETSAVDDSRPGFASLKSGSRRSNSNNNHNNTHFQSSKVKPRGQQHEKDHEAFKKFMRRERDRR